MQEIARRNAVFFFFSSRRRHTRFKCDWSSDVCSSDLSRHTSGFCRKEFLEAPASNASGISSHAGRVEKKTLFCGLRNTPSVRAHKQRSSLPIQSIESCSFHCRLVSSAKIRRHANPARPCPARTSRHKECRLVYRTWSSKVVP